MIVAAPRRCAVRVRGRQRQAVRHGRHQGGLVRARRGQGTVCPGFNTGVKLFIGSKVGCMFYLEICTTEGRGGGKGGIANFKTKHTEPLTQ